MFVFAHRLKEDLLFPQNCLINLNLTIKHDEIAPAILGARLERYVKHIHSLAVDRNRSSTEGIAYPNRKSHKSLEPEMSVDPNDLAAISTECPALHTLMCCARDEAINLGRLAPNERIEQGLATANLAKVLELTRSRRQPPSMTFLGTGYGTLDDPTKPSRGEDFSGESRRNEGEDEERERAIKEKAYQERNKRYEEEGEDTQEISKEKCEGT